MPDAPTILFDSFGGERFASSWRFNGYVKTVAAYQPEDVLEAFELVQEAAADGLYAAGFVAYEAASALNSDLPSVAPTVGLPLVWFALFKERHTADSVEDGLQPGDDVDLVPQKNLGQYSAEVELIRDFIAAGDCYQVNHTFPLMGDFKGNLLDLYQRVGSSQQARFCAYLDTGRFKILSASPELFFSLKNGVITTMPMKGTARRGRWAGEDIAAAEQLQKNPKERAENLMIVDLLRNDLGIVAETGSVQVEAMFEVETYPTVHQMTSTVSAQLRPGTALTDVFKALFPCGSVTGAPKRRSMEIIAELENVPRGVYCGAIGCIAPNGEALFSVAIRTLLHDSDTGQLTMAVGSAVTWDSEAASEYDECLSKGAFINQQPYDFSLIETLRLEHGVYSLLDRHIARLVASANYFGFVCDLEKIRAVFSQCANQAIGLNKVRLLLSADGSIDLTTETLTDGTEVLRVGISTVPVHSGDRFCYHKTTRRGSIDAARSSHPDCDEVLLLNEFGQLTEGSYHTLVVKLDGLKVTPPLSCGLLPGVLREQLLESGEISERILLPADLESADEIWCVNSVRGWRPATLVEKEK
jgi:para-aminobenzoate synthetase/4-amino-4-deoxychorismate lyase